ncbi:MAG: N-acetyltransferase [Pseudomonadota bacterium]
MYALSQEEPHDMWEVEALYDLVFVPGREALSSYRLREEVPPMSQFCRVARDSDAILAGAIRVWPVRVGTADALLLGPIAVHPTRQGEGLGALMIEDVMSRAQSAGWARAMLVGDLPYYSRFGFERLEGVQMPGPTNPERVLGRALIPGAWDAVTGPVTRAS